MVGPRFTPRVADLGDLEGCLIKTRFGMSIHVCRSVSDKRRSWVCYHELGHLLLGHRPNSEYGLNPALIRTDALRCEVSGGCPFDLTKRSWL
jgi:hypothetical protein